MSENRIQNSFAAGELADSLLARTDLAAYHIGLRRLRNMFVDYRSGASSRVGTKFVIQALMSSTAVRLVDFTFSVTTTYIIEFGDKYCRFINNGAAVLETGFTITTITQASPAIATAVGNNFINGDWVFIAGVAGMTQINGRFASVQISGSSVTLYDVNGSPIDSTSFGAWSGGGTISRVYKIASPYAASDLFPSQATNNPGIKYTQSASVMTITHPSYPPYTLTFNSPTNWVFTAIAFGSTSVAPTGVAVATSAAGAANYAFEVTTLDAHGQESTPSTPGVVAAAVNLSTTAGTLTVTWNPVAGSTSFNVYKAEMNLAAAVPSGAAFGFVGSATGVAFIDSNIVPDFATTPPINENPFSSANPGCNCYFQQRAWYAGSNVNPIGFNASQPGAYNNFNVSDPIQADDAISGSLVSLQVNAIKHMIPMAGGLVMLTAKGAWNISAGGGANATTAVTPINITASPQAYNGASDVIPIVSNYDILYVQAKGSIVRDLSYNIYAAIYTGTDISIRSNHLFFGHQIVQWAYAEEPFKIIWAVRDDGVLLSLTFMKEQEMYGWARHDTNGLFSSVASVTETPVNPNMPGSVDAVYVIAKRFIGGRWVQMIERMAERLFVYGAEDAWAVDCGVQSTLTTPAANLTASSNTGTVTFTADAAVFTANSVGQVIRMGGGIATVGTFTSPTIVVGTLSQNITNVLQDDDNTPAPAASGSWSIATPSTTFLGLDYLNGKTVSINADGAVITPQVVVNGAITLPQAASKVTAGLGFQWQFQTMPLDTGEPTVQGKRKKIGALNLKFKETRGVQAGRTFSTLVQMKDLTAPNQLGQPIPLITGDARVIMDPLWDVPGQICLQGNDPVPATILGVIPEIVIGDTK